MVCMITQTIPGYLSTAEASQILNITRAGISLAAKAEGWTPVKVGISHLYRSADVLSYRNHQKRTKLVKLLGHRLQGCRFYRISDIDMRCPECAGFAVMWPPPPEIADRWLCVDGHEGELE